MRACCTLALPVCTSSSHLPLPTLPTPCRPPALAPSDQESTNSNKSLALRLRPGDRNCHALVGERRGTPRRLLLKLTRPTGAAAASRSSGSSSGGGGGGWRAEVVAALPAYFSFTSPADFQYLQHDSRSLADQGEWVDGWMDGRELGREGRRAGGRAGGDRCPEQHVCVPGLPVPLCLTPSLPVH